MEPSGETCANCGRIGPEIHHEDTSPVTISELSLLERLTDSIWRCASCGTVFDYTEWTPGGSEDFQRTWYNARLRKKTPEDGALVLADLVEHQRIPVEQARRINLPLPAELPGDTAPLSTGTVRWVPLPARHQPQLAIDPSQDALYLAMPDGGVERVSFATQAPVWSQRGEPASYFQPAASPRGEWLAVVSSSLQTLALYDAATGNARRVPLPPVADVLYVPPPVWVSDSLLAVHVIGRSAQNDAALFVVDAQSATVLWETRGSGLRSILPSPTGNQLALWWFAAAGKNHVDVVDAHSGAVASTVPAPSNNGMAWANDSTRLFLAGYQVIHCVDVVGRAIVWQDDHDYTGDAAVRCAPDGKSVAFQLGKRGVVVRDAATGTVRWRRPIAHAVKSTTFVWLADSERLVTAGVDHEGASFRMWDREGRWLSTAALPAAPSWIARDGDRLIGARDAASGAELPVWDTKP